MKKTIITISLIISFIKAFGCDCDTPKPALEFYESDYVFEGNVISKIYAPDSPTYTITFDILKHYKKGSNPKKLEFTLKTDRAYNGVLEYTSCDWKVNKGEKWLVYARYWNGKLTFWYHCSNSKPLGERKIYPREQKILDNGNSFNLDNYIYSTHEAGFNYVKPISNIDSIFKSEKVKNYKKTFVWLDLYIDREGNLETVNLRYGRKIKADTIFGFIEDYGAETKAPSTEFERDAVDLVKKVKKWEIKRHNKTKIPVRCRKYLTVRFDKKKKKWKYSL